MKDHQVWWKMINAGNYGLNQGSDYFTENYQVKENKTKTRNIHSRFFISFFKG